MQLPLAYSGAVGRPQARPWLRHACHCCQYQHWLPGVPQATVDERAAVEIPIRGALSLSPAHRGFPPPANPVPRASPSATSTCPTPVLKSNIYNNGLIHRGLKSSPEKASRGQVTRFERLSAKMKCAKRSLIDKQFQWGSKPHLASPQFAKTLLLSPPL